MQNGGYISWRSRISFAVFTIDSDIDDFMSCENVRRGQFRLQPVGDEGISLGCITVINRSDLKLLRTKILSHSPKVVGKERVRAYGVLSVI